jgi:hypothetical protein
VALDAIPNSVSCSSISSLVTINLSRTSSSRVSSIPSPSLSLSAVLHLLQRLKALARLLHCRQALRSRFRLRHPQAPSFCLPHRRSLAPAPALLHRAELHAHTITAQLVISTAQYMKDPSTMPVKLTQITDDRVTSKSNVTLFQAAIHPP